MVSLPTIVSPQPEAPKSTSFRKLLPKYLQAFLFMIVLHAFFIICAGIFQKVTSSANHIQHLTYYWAFMAVSSGAILLLGLCSAWKDNSWTKICHVAMLIVFLQIILRLILLFQEEHICGLWWSSSLIILLILTVPSLSMTIIMAALGSQMTFGVSYWKHYFSIGAEATASMRETQWVRSDSLSVGSTCK